MCFSVNVNLIKEELEDRYGVSFPDKYRYEPSYYYHASGLPEVPAICSDNPGTVRLLKWGLIPSWVKTSEEADVIKRKTFNARAEGIDIKPSFSLSFKSKRCLIPVKGFFEWQHLGADKIPWYIYGADNEILTFAGLFSEWIHPGNGKTESTFSVITTEANELMAEIHNTKKRMPVILGQSDEKKWLNISISSAETLKILKPCPSDRLKAHTISPLINDRKANKNAPEIIEPFNYRSGNLLF